ncbi:MAG: NADH:ubiquinone reductase (Na(+)-transporting) subunit B [Planctomycetota bacterium]
MKGLRNLLDHVGHQFEKGGKFEKLYPFYEAADTFLFTPGHRTKSGPHVRDGIDLKRAMITVVFALLPCVLFALFNTGYQEIRAASEPRLGPLDVNFAKALWLGALSFVPVYAVTVVVGGLIEAVFAVVRKHEINEGFLVTSLLFPLTLPPDIPLWQVALGIAFGVVIGKEVFGGTGMNILNPALTGRIFLYFAYPAQISGDLVWIAGQSDWVDGFSGATPLATMFAYGSDVSHYAYSWWQCFLGFIPGSMGETSAVACLLGAFVLIFTKVGSWRIMAGSMLGMVAMTLLFNLVHSTSADADAHSYLAVQFHWHLVVGSFLFGTVFMATDPVSAAQTNAGRWIYGFLIGLLTILVRVINPAYPEGIMLAIVFMNVFAPLIDYYVVKANIRRREVRLGVQ